MGDIVGVTAIKQYEYPGNTVYRGPTGPIQQKHSLGC
jgi:hypothetical protein